MSEEERSQAGIIGVGIFLGGFACVCIAFTTPAWLVGDFRSTDAKLDSFGLWIHCVRNWENPLKSNESMRYSVECSSLLDVFLKKGILPLITRSFFMVCFFCCLVASVLIPLFVLCCSPLHKRYIWLIVQITSALLVGGLFGALAVTYFSWFETENIYTIQGGTYHLGYSYAFAVAGTCLSVMAGTMFFIESYMQRKKKKRRENADASQTGFRLLFLT